MWYRGWVWCVPVVVVGKGWLDLGWDRRGQLVQPIGRGEGVVVAV